MEQQQINDIIADSRLNKKSITVKESSGNDSKGKPRRGRPRRRLTFRRSLARPGVLQRRRENRLRTRRGSQERTKSNLRERRRIGARRRGVRLFIRNLGKNVTNGTLKNLFQKIGPLKRCGINYTKLGESKGTADIEYIYESDAYKAIDKFNYKLVNGLPIRIEVSGRRKRRDNSTRDRKRGYKTRDSRISRRGRGSRGRQMRERKRRPIRGGTRRRG